MDWIGIELVSNIIPRETEPTSTGSLITRELDKPLKEAKQMKATTEFTDACAASHHSTDWHTIDWYKVNKKVRQLQVRIVKATQEGRWGKVKALQRLLTHSFSGKALAVRRVTENQGKSTPGVDKETWNTPEKKAAAILSLQQRGYQPQPLLRKYIPKANGKKRPLGIPTMKDRAMQAVYLLALDPVAETKGDPNSYGFRQQRSTADAIEACFTYLAKKDQAQWILEGDIKSCFDRISHDWLLENIPTNKTMLRKWLKAGFMEEGVLHPTEEGTPQGGIISPVLANMALDGLERELRAKFPLGLRAGRTPKVHLVRYADDFIITGSSRELLEKEVLPLVMNFMNRRGLELSPDKTRITHIENGFDFLGQNVRKYKGKLIIKPTKKNLKAVLDKIRKEVKVNRTATAGYLITRLNPIIRGWANYHQHICSKDTYHYMDFAIYKLLWRWAKRRHPNKGARWIKKKYFASIGKRNWVFTGEMGRAEGKSRKVHLLIASYTKIRRHVKIKGDANPYDPTWESYFEHRIGVKVENNLRGRAKLLNLWRSQNGICPVCNALITEITGWHSHHIVWRSKGGSDAIANQVLLHPNCHNQVHSQKLTVVKPRPEKGVLEA
jgi:RNA-directed DNA polymerase